jgi:uncharacterized protein
MCYRSLQLPKAGEFSSAFFVATLKHHTEVLLLIAKLIAVCALLFAVFPPLALANDMLRAVEAGETDTVNALIAKGTPLDVPNAAGETALLIAVQKNQLDIALALIAGGANINAQAENMDTPWLLAGASGRTEMLRAMIPKGPDFSICNRYGGNALIPACERAHVETIEQLLTTKIDVNHINNLGWTCLLEIVILGDGGERHRQAAKLVLDAGADPNIADGNGVTPLAHARANGQAVVARLIEERGGR